jgi:hypothetical protein
MASETEEPSDTLSEFQRRFAQLPDVEEPPQTLLHVLRRGSKETYWNKILSYFLDPTEPHGFGTDLLEAFLSLVEDQWSLEAEPEREFDFDRLDFGELDVRSEWVMRDSGVKPDITIYSEGRWFVIIEMKVGASEGENQTPGYVRSEKIGNIDKSSFPDDGHYYVYLSEEKADDASANEFADIAWCGVVERLKKFQAGSGGRYPVKSYTQLKDFLDTIRGEMNMTDDTFEENQLEKMKLYFEYADAIDDARDAFESVHEQEYASWQERFLEGFEPPSWGEEWHCNPGEYGHIFKTDWRRKGRDEDFEPTLSRREASVTLHFAHSMSKTAFRNGELNLRTKWPCQVDLRKRFAKNLHSDETVERLQPILDKYDIERNDGQIRDYTQKTYTFDRKRLPNNYYETLATAFEEHQEMSDILSDVLRETLDGVR